MIFPSISQNSKLDAVIVGLAIGQALSYWRESILQRFAKGNGLEPIHRNPLKIMMNIHGELQTRRRIRAALPGKIKQRVDCIQACTTGVLLGLVTSLFAFLR